MAHRNLVKKWKFDRAREMRSSPTPPEGILWSRLRRRALGFKFRRQAVIFGWIADFWCPAKRLIIEVDGKMHDAEKDAKRDAAIAEHGIETIRFAAKDVMWDTDGVVEEIERILKMEG